MLSWVHLSPKTGFFAVSMHALRGAKHASVHLANKLCSTAVEAASGTRLSHSHPQLQLLRHEECAAPPCHHNTCAQPIKATRVRRLPPQTAVRLRCSPFASLLMTVFAAALKRITVTGLACRLLRLVMGSSLPLATS
jgi:hypothetical protein